MKTSTLTGPDLNRAVAMALGHEVVEVPVPHSQLKAFTTVRWCMLVEGHCTVIPDYAGDINVAWPIIKKHGISIRTCAGRWHAWFDDTDDEDDACLDDDPQVAAMQRFVQRVLGVDINLEQS